jgi:hypothetical protein
MLLKCEVCGAGGSRASAGDVTGPSDVTEVACGLRTPGLPPPPTWRLRTIPRLSSDIWNGVLCFMRNLSSFPLLFSGTLAPCVPLSCCLLPGSAWKVPPMSSWPALGSPKVLSSERGPFGRSCKVPPFSVTIYAHLPGSLV